MDADEQLLPETTGLQHCSSMAYSQGLAHFSSTDSHRKYTMMAKIETSVNPNSIFRHVYVLRRIDGTLVLLHPSLYLFSVHIFTQESID